MPVRNVDPEQFGAERGLFKDHPDADRAGGRPWDGTWRRNTDFLRLKDHALHLVAPAPGMKVLDLGCANGAQIAVLSVGGAGRRALATRAATPSRKLVWRPSYTGLVRPSYTGLVRSGRGPAHAGDQPAAGRRPA